MKTTMLALFLILVMASGCSTMRQVDMDHPDRWMADAQHDLLKKNVTLTMVDGTVAEGTLIKLNADSLSLQGENDQIPRIEPLNRVQSIHPSRQVLPVIGGFFGGALVGGVIGSQIGASSEKPTLETLGFNTFAATAGGMVVGWVLGAAAGSVGIGLLTSVTDYDFLQSQPRKPVTGAGVAMPDSAAKAK
jgi:hypothetical protein